MEITYNKRAEKCKNRVIIPKWYIEKYGRDFYMIIKDGEIILKSIKFKKKGE